MYCALCTVHVTYMWYFLFIYLFFYFILFFLLENTYSTRIVWKKKQTWQTTVNELRPLYRLWLWYIPLVIQCGSLYAIPHCTWIYHKNLTLCCARKKLAFLNTCHGQYTSMRCPQRKVGCKNCSIQNRHVMWHDDVDRCTRPYACVDLCASLPHSVSAVTHTDTS